MYKHSPVYSSFRKGKIEHKPNIFFSRGLAKKINTEKTPVFSLQILLLKQLGKCDPLLLNIFRLSTSGFLFLRMYSQRPMSSEKDFCHRRIYSEALTNFSEFCYPKKCNFTDWFLLQQNATIIII